MKIFEMLSNVKPKGLSKRIAVSILAAVVGLSAGIFCAPEKAGVVRATEKEFTLYLNGVDVEGSLEGEGDINYYKMVLPSAGWLTVSCNCSIGSAECRVVDANKNDLECESYYYGLYPKYAVRNESIALDKGTYYYRVAMDSSEEKTCIYSVSATLESANSNEQEPNNSFSEAVTLKENHEVKGFFWENDSDDYYKFDLYEDQKVSLYFSTNSDMSVIVYNSDMEQVGDHHNFETKERWIWQELEYELKKGSYYIHVVPSLYRWRGEVYELTLHKELSDVLEITIEGSEEMTVGETETFMATITPSKVENERLTWSSSDTSVADVDSNGKVTAKKAGNVTITASATDGSGVKGTIDITVVNVPVSKINIIGEKTIKQGKTTQLTATVTPNNAFNHNLKWTSSDTTIATVDDTGKVTAKKEGKVTINAAAKDGSKVSASFSLTVEKSKIPVTKIKITGTSTVEKGKSVTLKATVTPNNANDKKVKWSSSNTAVATVDSKGKVTAKKAGKVTIKAVAQDGSKVVGTLKITVKNPAALKKIEEVKPKAIGSRKVKITWKKQKAAKKYRIQVAADKKFTKAALVKTVAGSKDSITVTYKKTGTVYVRVRGIDSDGYAGEWSSAKTVKVK